MDIILHGPPGAGKGTQSDNICAQLGIVAISTGDLIRAEIKGKTELGEQIKAYSNAGKLVPDELVMTILSKRLEQDDVSSGVLFDGFPRTTNQAKMLDEWLKSRGRKVDAVFSLEISDKESMFRCSYRLGCSDTVNCKKNVHIYYQRPTVMGRSEQDHTPIFQCPKCGKKLDMREDALPSKIQTRIDTYHAETEPMLSKLKTDFSYQVFGIEGEHPIDAIKENINTVIAEHLK